MNRLETFFFLVNFNYTSSIINESISIYIYIYNLEPGAPGLQEHRRQQKPKEKQRSRKRGTTPKEVASKQGKTSNLRAIFEQNRDSSTSTKRKKTIQELHPIIMRALGRERTTTTGPLAM
jgi:hypothetical protein